MQTITGSNPISGTAQAWLDYSSTYMLMLIFETIRVSETLACGNALVGKLVKSLVLETREFVGSTPTECTSNRTMEEFGRLAHECGY